MAPSSLQEVFHSLHHEACHQWNQLTSAIFHHCEPASSSLCGASFVDGFGCDVHITNFLHSLGMKKRGSLVGGSFMHLPIPFAGLVFSRERRGKTSDKKDSAAQRGVLEANEALHIETRNERAPSKEPFQSAGAVQSSELQLESEVLLWAGPLSKEELGRATWTFLHMLAAQFPDKPTKQQQRDVKELMAILSRLYPCKECADHFKEVLKTNPVQVGSGFELAQWMCRVHNIVNRSLGKPLFPCNRVDARWGSMDCNEGACDLQGRMH